MRPTTITSCICVRRSFSWLSSVVTKAKALHVSLVQGRLQLSQLVHLYGGCAGQRKDVQEPHQATHGYHFRGRERTSAPPPYMPPQLFMLRLIRIVKG
jgi:hypothetical protein